MANLTEWLRVMLGEIARKQDEASRNAAEAARRQAEQAAAHTVRSAPR